MKMSLLNKINNVFQGRLVLKQFVNYSVSQLCILIICKRKKVIFKAEMSKNELVPASEIRYVWVLNCYRDKQSTMKMSNWALGNCNWHF